MSLTVIAQRMGITSFQRLVTGLVLSTLLVGCSSNKSSDVRIVDRNKAVAQRPAVTTGQYVVRPKDTLFSIAFRYGWDYKALAARNNIPAPYTIHPGQTIRFDGRTGSTPTTLVSSSNSTPSSSSKTTVFRRPVTGDTTSTAVVVPSVANKPAPVPMPAAGPAPTGWG
ncbi:MAG TPA: peptigoglycan-binding protein LysM, partial [Pseudomonas sp.]|nr:peptigoglycan-binding protein LysM [Pseudomonas sp.]